MANELPRLSADAGTNARKVYCEFWNILTLQNYRSIGLSCSIQRTLEGVVHVTHNKP